MFTSVIIVIALIILANSSIKVLRQYERGVIFTLGRFSHIGGPGLLFLIPFFSGEPTNFPIGPNPTGTCAMGTAGAISSRQTESAIRRAALGSSRA